MPANWTCVKSYDDGACSGVGCSPPGCRVQSVRLIGALSRRPVHVPSCADDRELAELRLRYENDESPRLRKTVRVFVESGITVIAVETENEDDGSDYGVGGCIGWRRWWDDWQRRRSHTNEKLKEMTLRKRRSAGVRVRA